MRPLFAGVALVALLSPSSAAAQSQSISELEALARLSPDSPRVRAIRAAVDIARADVAAASRWPYPRLVYDREAVASVTEHITTIGQTLPITGRRGLDVDAATALVAASTSRVGDELRRARADLRQAFAQLVATQTRERAITDALGVLRGIGDSIARREAAGDVSGFDRLRADREVLDVEADLALAATDRARAQAGLAAFFVDLDDPSQLRAVARERGSRADVPPLTALIEQAEPLRGELQALRKELEAAQFAEQAAGRRLIPEPEIVAGTKTSTAGGGDVGSVFSIQATLPLFGTVPERTLAVARAARAQAQIDAFRIALRSDIASWRAAVVERRQAADRYRTAVVTGAGDIQRIALVSYNAGERGILELLDASRSTLSATLRQATLDAAVRQAEIELEFVSGWEIP